MTVIVAEGSKTGSGFELILELPRERVKAEPKREFAEFEEERESGGAGVVSESRELYRFLNREVLLVVVVRRESVEGREFREDDDLGRDGMKGRDVDDGADALVGPRDRVGVRILLLLLAEFVLCVKVKGVRLAGDAVVDAGVGWMRPLNREEGDSCRGGGGGGGDAAVVRGGDGGAGCCWSSVSYTYSYS